MWCVELNLYGQTEQGSLIMDNLEQKDQILHVAYVPGA